MLAADVEQYSLAWARPIRGLENVLGFYERLVGSMDQGAKIQVEDATGDGDASLRVAVLW